jgi:hypothetical protein
MSIAKLEKHLFLEYMRAAVIDAVGRCGHTRLSVAEEAGIRVRSLSEFLRGGGLNYDSARKLNAWCQIWGFAGVWAEQAALSLLVDGLPCAARREARADFARWFKARFEGAGQPVPEWADDELEDCRLLYHLPRPHDTGVAA